MDHTPKQRILYSESKYLGAEVILREKKRGKMGIPPLSFL